MITLLVFSFTCVFLSAVAGAFDSRGGYWGLAMLILLLVFVGPSYFTFLTGVFQ